ncbi:methylmalonyl-CoA mutase [Lysinibacillus sp. PLM2]|nr:methylmalonyl-CoA mutase [Lysinibacillus sp. PLM2]
MTNNMKHIQFNNVSYEQWREEAVKALKGKPFETLFTPTTDGVTLKPLYTQEIVIEKLGEQLEKQISTIRSLKATKDFSCAQQIFGDTEEQFFKSIEDSLERGNQILTIDSRVSFYWNETNISRLASILEKNPFKLIVQNTNDDILKVFEQIEHSLREQVSGYILSKEPITINNYPNVRTLAANTLPYHYEGANVIQELALSLALAAKFANNENNFAEFINKFYVNFAVDTQFFSEIAKLRAFKILWKAFSKAYNAESNIAVPIVAETSLRSFSKFDEYVNLLRAGNEALSALIGGADVFTVHPHDVLVKPTEKSIRIARNVILVLKEESYAASVFDPSGGSYFIEYLTAEYVEKSWSLFLEIEDAGGIDAFAESGNLQTILEEVRTARLKSIETRKHSLIGTNIYANPEDDFKAETNPLFVDVKRLSTPFEELRIRYKNLQPKISILTYGKLKNFKPRADFVSGFFATVGIVVNKSGEIDSIADLLTWINDTDSQYIVLVATDEDTKIILPSILENKRKDLIIDVAGKFKEEEKEWVEKGLNGFIFAGQNLVEKLNVIAERLKGEQQ